LTLGVDVELPHGVHVYAPDVKGYIPVSFALTESKAFRSEAPMFPAGQNVELAAIHETVPAFEGSLRVLQNVMLANAQTPEPLLDGNRTPVLLYC